MKKQSTQPKTCPPSELTLDILCSMTPKDVLEYITDMEKSHECKYYTQLHRLNYIIFGLRDDKKALEKENKALKEALLNRAQPHKE